jgi:hypothetical protein
MPFWTGSQASLPDWKGMRTCTRANFSSTVLPGPVTMPSNNVGLMHPFGSGGASRNSGRIMGVYLSKPGKMTDRPTLQNDPGVLQDSDQHIGINTSTDAVWQVICDFGMACQYLARVVACTLEGEGVGARRTLTSTDGSAIVERLETLGAVNHRLSYALLTETPFRNCVTIMSVRNLGSSQAELEWSATFEADGLPADEPPA